jgi:xylan 1,4-beta-xylosidase
MNVAFTIVVGFFLAVFTSANKTYASANEFYEFTYEGKDPVFEPPLKNNEYRNPILAGFYPDPSIVRVNDDYYLVNSSFSYSPGVPIFHSKDLVNWKSLGSILISPKQLPLQKQTMSRGIYAPTIRYHNGIFYLITTLVDVQGNFIVTATDPAGPWSDPILLPEIGGIDPDLFFDDDGKIYIAHNEAPIGKPLYDGHRAIWLWEFDLKTKKVVKNSGRVIVNGGVDIAKKPIWIEGPHLYKINGWYYLLCAEGGTSDQHSQVVFRSKHLQEPFIPYVENPILTQRDLAIDRKNPVANTGHADLVQTKEGEWWAVFLGVRPYEKNLFNTGRETFLLPVTWKEGWPIILEKGKSVPYQHTAPKIQQKTASADATLVDIMTGNFLWKDSFEKPVLGHEWLKLRMSDQEFVQIRKGSVSLQAKNVRLDSLEQPAYLGRRQQHTHFVATTEMSIPAENTSAGLVAFQGEQHHYYFGVKTFNHRSILFIEQAKGAAPQTVYQTPLEKGLAAIKLQITVNADKISFHYSNKQGQKQIALENADAKILSTEIAGGFIGATIGIHARQENMPTHEHQ